ncbi:MAG: hypothetical protein OEY29_14665 [Gammaproteobacteria bacterium]|nr:hypothetical protein [Gammaproteobacteria bacterium]
MELSFKKASFKFLLAVISLSLSSLSSSYAADDVLYKPFVMAKTPAGDFSAVIASTKSALTKAGFDIVGDYSPYENAHVLSVTNKTILNIVKDEERGAYGAVQRVSVSNVNGKVQVAFANPEYMAYGYRFKNNFKSVRADLIAALGYEKDFGSQGLSEKKLRKYNYAWGMEEFDEPNSIAEHNSYKAAIAEIEKGFKSNKVGATKVYRVDIPGKDVTIYGVGLKSPKMFNKYQDDGYIMSVIDFDKEKHLAHLPYEMVVFGNKIEALNGRFRIALSFPDLSMAGENSFMNIMGAPGGINSALKAVAGGKLNDF